MEKSGKSALRQQALIDKERAEKERREQSILLGEETSPSDQKYYVNFAPAPSSNKMIQLLTNYESIGKEEIASARGLRYIDTFNSNRADLCGTLSFIRSPKHWFADGNFSDEAFGVISFLLDFKCSIFELSEEECSHILAIQQLIDMAEMCEYDLHDLLRIAGKKNAMETYLIALKSALPRRGHLCYNLLYLLANVDQYCKGFGRTEWINEEMVLRSCRAVVCVIVDPRSSAETNGWVLTGIDCLVKVPEWSSLVFDVFLEPLRKASIENRIDTSLTGDFVDILQTASLVRWVAEGSTLSPSDRFMIVDKCTENYDDRPDEEYEGTFKYLMETWRSNPKGIPTCGCPRAKPIIKCNSDSERASRKQFFDTKKRLVQFLEAGDTEKALKTTDILRILLERLQRSSFSFVRANKPELMIVRGDCFFQMKRYEVRCLMSICFSNRKSIISSVIITLPCCDVSHHQQEALDCYDQEDPTRMKWRNQAGRFAMTITEARALLGAATVRVALGGAANLALAKEGASKLLPKVSTSCKNEDISPWQEKARLLIESLTSVSSSSSLASTTSAASSTSISVGSGSGADTIVHNTPHAPVACQVEFRKWTTSIGDIFDSEGHGNTGVHIIHRLNLATIWVRGELLFWNFATNTVICWLYLRNEHGENVDRLCEEKYIDTSSCTLLVGSAGVACFCVHVDMVVSMATGTHDCFLKMTAMCFACFVENSEEEQNIRRLISDAWCFTAYSRDEYRHWTFGISYRGSGTVFIYTEDDIMSTNHGLGPLALLPRADPKRLVGHDRSVCQIEFADAAGRTVVTCSSDNLVKIWNVETQVCLGTIRDYTDTVVFARSIRSLGVLFINVTSSKFYSAKLSLVASHLTSHFISVWDIAGLTAEGASAAVAAGKAVVAPRRVATLCIDGAMVAAASDSKARADAQLKLTGNLINEKKRDSLRVTGIDVIEESLSSPRHQQRSLMVSAHSDHRVHVWRVSRGAPLGVAKAEDEKGAPPSLSATTVVITPLLSFSLESETSPKITLNCQFVLRTGGPRPHLPPPQPKPTLTPSPLLLYVSTAHCTYALALDTPAESLSHISRAVTYDTGAIIATVGTRDLPCAVTNCGFCGLLDFSSGSHRSAGLCGGCKTVFFCNKQCQTSGWKSHKEFCISLTKKKKK